MVSKTSCLLIGASLVGLCAWGTNYDALIIGELKGTYGGTVAHRIEHELEQTNREDSVESRARSRLRLSEISSVEELVSIATWAHDHSECVHSEPVYVRIFDETVRRIGDLPKTKREEALKKLKASIVLDAHYGRVVLEVESNSALRDKDKPSV